VIVSNEIREGDGVPLARERRVWAAGRAMHLDPKEPAPLALYPPYCRWRQLALEELDRAGRPWTLVLQSAGTAGIVAALDAGLAITVFPEFNLPNSLKALGAAEALPALPDFEFVPRRSRNSSLAADHLAEMIINFFQLSTALRPGDGMNYKQRRISCCGPASRPRIALTRASGSPRWRGVSVRKNRGSDWRGSSS
jgi:DNA-binding transcriptional LysR family regulator